jgi:hypothetical protein
MLSNGSLETCPSEEQEVDTEITADGLKTLASNGDSVSASFDKIKYAKQTKKYIFLTTHSGVVFPIKKDTFTVGTKDEFVAYIRSRGINVKFKK